MENSKKISFSEQGQGDMLESVSGGKVKKILRAAVMAVGVVISPQVKTAENNQDMTEASRPVNYDAPKVTNSNGYTRPNIETYNYSPVSSPKQSDLINDNYVSPEYGSVNYDAPKVDKIETIEGLEKSLVKIADNLSQKFKEDLKSKNLSRVGISLGATSPVSSSVSFVITFLSEDKAEKVFNVYLEKGRLSNSYVMEEFFGNAIVKELRK